jgi:hypothetical protein
MMALHPFVVLATPRLLEGPEVLRRDHVPFRPPFDQSVTTDLLAPFSTTL